MALTRSTLASFALNRTSLLPRFGAPSDGRAGASGRDGVAVVAVTFVLAVGHSSTRGCTALSFHAYCYSYSCFLFSCFA